jgi:uncharacterized protein YjbJ (UPF0337 family)
LKGHRRLARQKSREHDDQSGVRPSTPERVMGTLKGTAEKAIGKIKEVVAEIAGDGKLRDEGKVEQRNANQEKSESGGIKPLGNLDRLT